MKVIIIILCSFSSAQDIIPKAPTACGNLKYQSLSIMTFKSILKNNILFLYIASIPSFMNFNKIVGGQRAPSMIPWQVSVTFRKSGDGHFCGGTILDSTTILSAAHCGVKVGHYIRAGSRNRRSGGQVINYVIS